MLGRRATIPSKVPPKYGKNCGRRYDKEYLARREMPLRAAGEAQGRLDPRAVEYRKHLIAALLARATGVGSFRATTTEGKAATIHLGEESRSPSLYPHG